MGDNTHPDFGWKIIPDDGIINPNVYNIVLQDIDNIINGVTFTVEIYWGSYFHGYARIMDNELVLICFDTFNIDPEHKEGARMCAAISDKEIRINSTLYNKIVEKIASLGA